MPAVYLTIYRDVHGEETTVIENDGQTLRMVVRGVEFKGSDFDSFTPAHQEVSSSFTLHRSNLCGYQVQCNIPVIVVGGEQEEAAAVHVLLELGSPTAEGRIDKEELILTLKTRGGVLKSSGKSGGFFEGEMLDIQRQLPPGTYMKCCFNCAFSGYSPYGDGLWGMYCHRNHKEAYVHANDKPEWMRLDDVAAERVQEIHFCPEFEQWNGKTGYRDPLQPYVIKTQ